MTYTVVVILLLIYSLHPNNPYSHDCETFLPLDHCFELKILKNFSRSSSTLKKIVVP